VKASRSGWLTDRRGLPYVTGRWPMYITECCAATVTNAVGIPSPDWQPQP
jgi:hypothetical protein